MGKVLTAIDKSKSFRVYIGISTDMVEEAREIHKTSPLATAALGRVLTGAGLMGLQGKNEDDKVTLLFKGDGPAKQILATADGRGNVKGYIANPDIELPLKEDGHLDVGGSLGIGELTVIKDIGLKEPYVGKISLVSGEIADDLTAYYYISEQVNSSVALGVKIGTDAKVLCSGGMIINMLPKAEEAAVDALENMLKDMEPMTTLIEKAVLQSADKTEAETVKLLLDMIFGDLPEEFSLEVMEEKEMRWYCGCSKERFAQALTTIGKDDLKQIIEEDGEAEVVCQFCESKYHFDKDELEEILAHVDGGEE